jgi:hypothetical protein
MPSTTSNESLSLLPVAAFGTGADKFKGVKSLSDVHTILADYITK